MNKAKKNEHKNSKRFSVHIWKRCSSICVESQRTFIRQRNDLGFLAKSRQPTTFKLFSLTFVWVNSLKSAEYAVAAHISSRCANQCSSLSASGLSPAHPTPTKRQTHALVFENPIICKMQNVYFPTFRAPKYNNNYNSTAEPPVNMHTFLAKCTKPNGKSRFHLLQNHANGNKTISFESHTSQKAYALPPRSHSHLR